MRRSARIEGALSTGLLLLATVMPACSAAPRKPEPLPRGDYSYAREHLRYRIAALMEDGQLPGFAIALIDDQDVVWQEMFGVSAIETGAPLALDTTFKVGSLSKLFTAMEIMRLRDEGRIDLDAPIATYLPEFSMKSRFPNARPLTIRSILAHRSGLPRNGNLPTWYWDPGPEVLRDLVQSLRDSYVAFEPGSRYKYSNVGYDILGRIIERERDVGFPIWMKDNLLAPMGMRHSAFLAQHLPGGAKVATGHAIGDGRLKALDQGDIITMPSGSLYSTLGDLCEFAMFVLRGGSSKESQVIETKTLEEMFQVQFTDPRDPQENGLGWFTDRRALAEKLVFHSGTCQGTISFLALLPERKLGVICIANSSAFEDLAPTFVVEALELVLETKFGISRLGRFAGKFILNGEVVEIIDRGGRLKARAQGHLVDLVPVHRGMFWLKHWLLDIGNLTVEFFAGNRRDDDIMLLTVEGSFDITCPRYPDVEEVPSSWKRLAGTYEVRTRLKSAYSNASVLDHAEIRIDDNVLRLPQLKAALWPITDTEILLVGGIFDGETMAYDAQTGNIVWQNVIYKPKVGPARDVVSP
jgi:CubicO group peptidase (beta-lactamase class C family)